MNIRCSKWWPKGFSIGSVALGVCFGLAFTVLLSQATEEWRVYGNDILPRYGSGSVLDTGDYFKLFVWILISGLPIVAIVHSARKKRLAWLALPLLLPAFWFCRWAVIDSRLKDCIQSCANHSMWWTPIEFDYSEPLPASTEFADLLAAFSNGRPRLNGARCPGYRRADTKTGVVFVGGGLQLDQLSGHTVLLAFCSVISHPPPRDIQRAVVWLPGTGKPEDGNILKESGDTSHIVALLEQALAQASSGKVPYSDEAQGLLRNELKARKQELGEE